MRQKKRGGGGERGRIYMRRKRRKNFGTFPQRIYIHTYIHTYTHTHMHTYRTQDLRYADVNRPLFYMNRSLLALIGLF